MEHTNLVLLFKLFIVLAVIVLLFSRPFRGGRPPTPMHPSPADDAVLLLRKRRRGQHASISAISACIGRVSYCARRIAN
jgi:hypothetical protein